MHDNDDDEFKSKSQVKREMTALTHFAEELINAGSGRLADSGLSEPVMKAIAEGEKIKAHGGRKRQIKYVGKLLRSVDDALLERIRASLDSEGLEEKQREKRITRLRDALIAEGDAALTEVLALYPGADRQHLRQLTRKARQEAEQEKNQGGAKALLRALRHLDQEHVPDPVE